MVLKSLIFTLFTIAILLFTKLVSPHLFISISPTLLLSLSLLFISFIFYLSQSTSTLPPGPRAVPIFGNWLQVGNDLNHRLLATMSQAYGSVFMLKLGSKNLVVVSDPELATQVLHTQGVEFGSRPRNVVFDIFTGNGQDMVFTVYGDHWRKMRRIMTLPFFEYNYGDFIPLLRPFLRGYLNKCRDLQRRRLAFFNQYYVEERRRIMAANGEKHRISCAIDHIIDAQTKGEITEENVLYIVENINVAAIETTLWSIEWAIAELVNHPTVQRKIRDEITAVLKGRPVTESNLHELPYLQATVKETLRLHIPIPLLVPHMNLEEAKLGGYKIPKESKIVVNAWWLANNPDWWKNPSEFRPERFMEEEGGTEAVTGGKVDFRYLPFGVGRRSCPGIVLTLPILGLVIAKLVAGFEMRAPPGAEKVDVTEKGGQFSLHIANHSTVVLKPIVT